MNVHRHVLKFGYVTHQLNYLKCVPACVAIKDAWTCMNASSLTLCPHYMYRTIEHVNRVTSKFNRKSNIQVEGKYEVNDNENSVVDT